VSCQQKLSRNDLWLGIIKNFFLYELYSEKSEMTNSYVHLSDQTKDYKIGICCFSAKHAALRRKNKDGLARIVCPSGATCLSADYCFSELAL
jgi:hypothetical protein